MADALVDLGVELLGVRRISLAELLHRAAERRALPLDLILNGEGVRALRPRVMGDARDLRQQRAQFADLHRQPAEIGGIADADTELPFGNRAADAVIDLEQRLRVLVCHRGTLRQRDAARFQHHGEEQPADPLHGAAAGIGGLEFRGERGMLARVEHGDRRQRQRHGGHQGKDRIELGGDRKLRQCHETTPPT